MNSKNSLSGVIFGGDDGYDPMLENLTADGLFALLTRRGVSHRASDPELGSGILLFRLRSELQFGESIFSFLCRLGVDCLLHELYAVIFMSSMPGIYLARHAGMGNCNTFFTSDLNFGSLKSSCNDR